MKFKITFLIVPIVIAYILNNRIALGENKVVVIPFPMGEASSSKLNLPEYYVEDYGAKCDGETNDTLAFTNGLRDISAKGGGVLKFKGLCRACGITLYRSTFIDGGSIVGSEIKATDNCDKNVISSENYASLTGKGYAYGIYATVPSWIGLRNMRINGNWGGVQDISGIAMYGPGQLLENVYVYNCSGWGILTEDANSDSDSGYWNYGWQSQEEGRFINVYSIGNQKGGWWFRGPHDTYIDRYIGAHNQQWGFYSEAPSDIDPKWNSYIDHIGEMHTYSNQNSAGTLIFGMKFGGGIVSANHLLSDGDRIEIDSSANDSTISSVTQWGCGKSNEDCLLVKADGVSINSYFANMWSSNYNFSVINWSGSRGYLGNSSITGTGASGVVTALNIGGIGNRIGAGIYNLNSLGSVGILMNNNSASRIEGIINTIDTGIKYLGGAGNNVNVTIKSCNNALIGIPNSSDNYSLTKISCN